MRKLFGALLLVVALAGTIAASGAVALAQDEQPQRGGRLELVALNDLATLDNTQALDLDYNMVAGALYEGLYHFDPQGELEPGPGGRPAGGLRGRPRLHLPHQARRHVRRSRLRAARGHRGGRRLRHAARARPRARRCTHPGLGRQLPLPHQGRGGLRGRRGRDRRGHRGHRRPHPPGDPRAAHLHLPAGPHHRHQLARAPGGRGGARRGLRQPPGGRRTLLRPGVEQGLGHHHRPQPGLRGPGAALPRRDPRRPRRGREHAGPAPRVGRG